eukprot:14437364-Alexandrium_andersonii.AAC.1
MLRVFAPPSPAPEEEDKAGEEEETRDRVETRPDTQSSTCASFSGALAHASVIRRCAGFLPGALVFVDCAGFSESASFVGPGA